MGGEYVGGLTFSKWRTDGPLIDDIKQNQHMRLLAGQLSDLACPPRNETDDASRAHVHEHGRKHGGANQLPSVS
jgi:hypothetical protein